MSGFRAPLQVVVDDTDHGALASAAADTARPFLRRAASECDLAGQPLLAHKARSALLLLDEVQEGLAGGRAPAA